MESTAIVTGGSRGLGRAYCVALADAGFNVVVADLLDTREAVGDIEAAGGRAIGVHADISSAADNDALAAAAVDAFGTIDVFVVAGRAIKRTQMPEDMVGTILYLAGSGSDFITGQNLLVNGGAYYQ